MPHTLPEFDQVYERAVQRIEVNELVQMLDMLSWDELGVRMFERAFLLVAPHLREKGVEFVREDVLRSDRTDFASGAVRENLSAAQTLKTQPWIASWALPWYWWEKHAQKPDGLFSITLKHGGQEDELVICYECDGHAKDERHEMRKVAMKMWQAVDAARWTRRGSPKREDLPCYTVRSNFVRARLLAQITDPVQRGLAALYRLMRAHIYSILLIVDDWLASLPGAAGALDGDTSRLPRSKGKLYDHHIFVGCFMLPPEQSLRLIPRETYRTHDMQHYQSSYETNKFDMPPQAFASYMTVGSNLYHVNDLNDRPLPLIRKTLNPGEKETYDFSDRVEKQWRAAMLTRSWDEIDCSSMSFERVNLNKVDTFMNSPKATKHIDHLSGVWYLSDVKTILEKYSRSPILGIIFDWWDPSKHGQEVFRIRSQRPIDSAFKEESPVTYLIQNIMTRIETSLLSVMKTDDGFAKGKGVAACILRWDLNKFTGYRTEKLKDGDKAPLISIKKLLRDDPQKLRQRHQQSTDSWEDYNRRNGTLRSRCYEALEKDLPELDEHVQRYLEQFQVPQAALFFRLIRCNSILALRELARQVDAKRMDQAVARHLATLDVCVQSEVNFIFDRVRENLDVFVDTPDVKTLADVGPAAPVALSDTQLLLELARTLWPEADESERLLTVGVGLRAKLTGIGKEVYDLAELLFDL